MKNKIIFSNNVYNYLTSTSSFVSKDILNSIADKLSKDIDITNYKKIDNNFYLYNIDNKYRGVFEYNKDDNLIVFVDIYDKNQKQMGTNFMGANLESANLENSNFSNSIFSDANLKNANLKNAIFENSKFINSILINASMNGAILKNSDLSNANLQDADLSDADLTDIKNFMNVSSFENTKLLNVKGLKKDLLDLALSKGAIV